MTFITIIQGGGEAKGTINSTPPPSRSRGLTIEIFVQMIMMVGGWVSGGGGVR